MVEVLEVYKMKNNANVAIQSNWINSNNYYQKSIFATETKNLPNSFQVLSNLKNSGVLKTEIGDVIKFRNNSFVVGYHGFKPVMF